MTRVRLAQALDAYKQHAVLSCWAGGDERMKTQDADLAKQRVALEAIETTAGFPQNERIGIPIIRYLVEAVCCAATRPNLQRLAQLKKAQARLNQRKAVASPNGLQPTSALLLEEFRTSMRILLGTSASHFVSYKKILETLAQNTQALLDQHESKEYRFVVASIARDGNAAPGSSDLEQWLKAEGRKGPVDAAPSGDVAASLPVAIAEAKGEAPITMEVLDRQAAVFNGLLDAHPDTKYRAEDEVYWTDDIAEKVTAAVSSLLPSGHKKPGRRTASVSLNAHLRLPSPLVAFVIRVLVLLLRNPDAMATIACQCGDPVSFGRFMR